MTNKQQHGIKQGVHSVNIVCVGEHGAVRVNHSPAGNGLSPIFGPNEDSGPSEGLNSVKRTSDSIGLASCEHIVVGRVYIVTWIYETHAYTT